MHTFHSHSSFWHNNFCVTDGHSFGKVETDNWFDITIGLQTSSIKDPILSNIGSLVVLNINAGKLQRLITL